MTEHNTKALDLGWREQAGKHVITARFDRSGRRVEIAIREDQAALIAYARSMAEGAEQDAAQILAEGREWSAFADAVERGELAPDPADVTAPARA